MSRFGRASVFVGTATLAACSAFAPYSTTPAAPDTGAADSGPRVAICYNAVNSAPDKVLAEAQSECGTGAVAQPVETDYNLVHCPLLLPGRATFVCTPKK